MARCRIGKKKIRKYREQTGLPIVTALTRGGTNHRIDLCLEDGSVIHWHKDGSMEKSTWGWGVEEWKKGKTIIGL